jgi:putative exosortase-associated protein (TIGR04073 family)
VSDLVQKVFTRDEIRLGFVSEIMRIAATLSLLGLAAVLATGCAGPERKLGRGIMNATEFARLGELRRTMEQTALFEGADASYTTGFIRGINRSLIRTGMGAFEIATFPVPTPTYGPLLCPTSRVYPDITAMHKTYPFGIPAFTENPTYPDSYKPGLIGDATFATDTALGFSGGDVVPFVPGSRFRIFDN